jgi:hypothetical protein
MIVEALDLFPTRVFVIKDFLTKDEVDKFHLILDQLEPSGSSGHSGVYLRSNKNNFITTGIDFFYERVQHAVKEYYKVDVDIFESIYNYMNQGQSLLFHHHVNLADWGSKTLRTFSVLSGCYYTNSGQGFAKLRFNNPQLLSTFIGEQPALNLQPDANTLVLFPSWALHGTTTHESNVTRKCLVMEMTLK